MEEEIDDESLDLFEPFYDDEWAEQMHCAVTVCDTEGKILYMNEKSRATFASHGDLIGHNMFECHSPQSQAKIRELMATDGTNSYTIQKNGVKKMIYQTTWKRDGKVAGLVEISMVIPEEMPHYVRS
ncbi:MULTISPECIES: PAS domain-containing protein [Prevotellaceae]|uniref:PAS fold protein n=1 Tax=Xylanibacter rarus TaxID=1676614 RepID=A0A8E1QYW4_9BACT|nr:MULTISPECIES: PAS domain-containing protein [Prevotellaceae]KOO69273.1 PAS fold protein [Xylanibacter rarus]HJH76073.1 PAS domain-containing protein [Prevotellaceae bacterium]